MMKMIVVDQMMVAVENNSW